MASGFVPEFRPHRVDWTDEKVARFWDFLAAHHASEFFSEKHGPDIARRVPGRRVVDIGCGTGALVAELVRRGKTVVGIDSSPEVLEAARHRAPLATFHLGSLESLPLPDRSMDAATLIEVVEHLDDETLDAAIAEARRVLKPGGTLFITTPNGEDLDMASRQCPDCGAEFHVYQHVRAWTASSLADFLSLRGFEPRVAATRLVERGSIYERALRRLAYAVRRQRPRLVVDARRIG